MTLGRTRFHRAWRHCRRRHTFDCRRNIGFGRVSGLDNRQRSSRVDRRFFASLQPGQLIVLQFNQTLQLVQLALQVFHPVLQLGIFTTAAVQTFLAHRQLFSQFFRIPGSALACLSGNQAQDILLHSLGSRGRQSFTTGRIELLGQRYSATAITPISVLRRHFVDRPGLRQLHALRSIRQAQHLAGFKTVDITVDKRIGVQGLNRQHGLLHRAAVARPGGNLPQRVTGCGGVLPRLGRGRRCRRSGLWRELRRIEQHAVVAHQAAVGPHHLHQKIHKRFGQRLAGGDAQNALAIGVDDRSKTQVIQKCRARHPGLAELLLGGQAWHHLRGSQVLDIEQLDFRQQRLVLLRLERQFSELKRLRHTG